MSSEVTQAETATSADVLLVDDDTFVLRLLAAVFKRRGISVVTATSGEDALRTLETLRPELIIADVRMPGMGGYELCRRIRARGLDEIPFIFCSALGSVPERVVGLRLGADDYITKPVNTEELVLRVGGHLERVRRLQDLRGRPEERSDADVMSGQLGGLAVADVVQVAALLRRPAAVHLEHPDGARGVIWLNGSQALHAEQADALGMKAMLRLLPWERGSFRIEELAFEGARSLTGLIDEAVLDGLAQLDEAGALRESLPGPRLVVDHGSDVFARPFDERLAQVLALIEIHELVDQVVARSPYTEAETLRAVFELMSAGVVTASA